MKKTVLLNLLLITSLSFAVDLILDGATIALDSSNPVTIDSNGNINITSQNGSLTCAAAPPVLSSFNVAPATINSGDDVTVSWHVEGNPTSCLKTASPANSGWSGNVSASNLINGNHSLVVPNITASTTFSLRCSNDFGNSNSVSDNTTVNGTGVNCSSQPPILNGNADTTVRIVVGVAPGQPGSPTNPLLSDGTYDQVAPGSGWPGSIGPQSYLSLSKNKYVALRFTTDNTDIGSNISFYIPGNPQGPASIGTALSISECPGDFNNHLNQPKCLVIGGGAPSMRWTQNPAASAAGFCKLEHNKTYYFNIVHSSSQSTNFSSSACATSACGIIFTQ